MCDKQEKDNVHIEYKDMKATLQRAFKIWLGQKLYGMAVIETQMDYENRNIIDDIVTKEIDWLCKLFIEQINHDIEKINFIKDGKIMTINKRLFEEER